MQRPGKFLRVRAFLFLSLWLTAAFSLASSEPPMDTIPYNKAKKIALKARPGKIKDFQLEQKKEEWVYFFKILSADQVVHEVIVDAETGKVVSGALKVKRKKAPQTE
jgi:hypothetical protein